MTSKKLPEGHTEILFTDGASISGKVTGLEGVKKGDRCDLHLTDDAILKNKVIKEIKPAPTKYYEATEKPERTLFNNPVDTEQAFGITRSFTDKYKRLVEEITPETAGESYKYNKKVFRSKTGSLALRVIDEKDEIKTADQFYRALERIKSGKVLQTLLALWAYSNRQGNFFFNGVKLSKVMETVLKKPKSGYFTQDQRKEFSEAIHHLRDFEIYLDQHITDTDDAGKKRTMIKRDFYRLIDLIGAVYTKRAKDFKDELGNVIYRKGTADESVIVRIYGELLPRFNKGIMRGRLYSRGLLELDANKDERAILLGFKLLTRFDQIRQGKRGKNRVSDDRLYIRVDRKTLIEWANYKRSDTVDKWSASQLLKKTLDKLIDVNCLKDYNTRTDKTDDKADRHNIITDDDLQITLYPHPIALKLPEKEAKEAGFLPLYEKPEKDTAQSWGHLPIPEQKKAFIKWLIRKDESEANAVKIMRAKFRKGAFKV